MAFGECPQCDRPLERPFWDEICFACQDEDRLEDVLDDAYAYDDDDPAPTGDAVSPTGRAEA